MDLAPRNLLAAFRDLEGAQQALALLDARGFADEDVSVLGQPLEEIDLTSTDQGAEPDVKHGTVASNTAAGVSLGTLAGGALGIAGTALVAAIPGVGIAGIGLLAGAVAGAGLGGTVGGIVEGEASLRSDHSWGQALESVQSGAIVVGVHAADRIDEAAEALGGLTPQTLHVTDGRGRVLEDLTAEQPGPHPSPEAAFDTPDDEGVGTAPPGGDDGDETTSRNA